MQFEPLDSLDPRVCFLIADAPRAALPKEPRQLALAALRCRPLFKARAPRSVRHNGQQRTALLNQELCRAHRLFNRAPVIAARRQIGHIQRAAPIAAQERACAVQQAFKTLSHRIHAVSHLIMRIISRFFALHKRIGAPPAGYTRLI